MEAIFADLLAKEEQKKKAKKEQKKLAKQLKADNEAKASAATKGIQSKGMSTTQGATKGESEEGFKVPLKSLGKRARNPNPTEIAKDLKKKKIKKEPKAGSSKGETSEGEASEVEASKGEASKKGKKPKGSKKKKQSKGSSKKEDPVAFKTPDSPPTTSKGKIDAKPITPEEFPTKGIDPSYTPARPKGVSRLIKIDISIEEEEDVEPDDWEFDDNEPDTDSPTDELFIAENSAEDSSDDEDFLPTICGDCFRNQIMTN